MALYHVEPRRSKLELWSSAMEGSEIRNGVGGAWSVTQGGHTALVIRAHHPAIQERGRAGR